MSAIRIIRVLRPLRTLNRVKKLRVIVLTLLGSMKQLANVGVLILFLFTIYSIVGIQVRSRRVCADECGGEYCTDDSDGEGWCPLWPVDGDVTHGSWWVPCRPLVAFQ